ncbi:MAG: hypothetical protein M0Z46_21030 [Actinomycetota bacterium]|jgi:hypothetical protein|nr:hypothetical protein [Actinomycetota bacterium]
MSISRIAAWSHNTRCPTAAAAFAGRVDLDNLLVGTTFEAEVGESPFMRQRGRLFEDRVRRDGYKDLVPILKDQLDFPSSEVQPLNLKDKYPPNTKGFELRATATKEWLERVLSGDRKAPDLIEGAVLGLDLGGFVAYFEADGIGVRTGPVIHGIEMKSWPQVDGRVDDPSKASEAMRQLGFYLHLLRVAVAELGEDPDVVSETGLLVTPKNIGLTPVGGTRALAREIALAEATIARLPRVADYAPLVAEGISFGPVAASNEAVAARLEHLASLTERLGTHYQTSCIGSCGLAKFCRAQRHADGDPHVCGTQVARFLPGVPTLSRAADLAKGASPTAEETKTGVAPFLALAGSLYAERAPMQPR